MAFWKVYKYRSKHRYMYDWIWWHKIIGQYPEEQWDAIKKELQKQREKKKRRRTEGARSFLESYNGFVCKRNNRKNICRHCWMLRNIWKAKFLHHKLFIIKRVRTFRALFICKKNSFSISVNSEICFKGKVLIKFS